MSIRIQCGASSWEVDGVLFDKDGTLLDFAYLWGAWSSLLMERLRHRALGVNWETVLGLCRDGEKFHYDPLGPLAMGSNREIAALLAGHLYLSGLAWNEAITAVLTDMKHVSTQIDELRPVRAMPGVFSFVQQLSREGVPIGIVTSDDTEAAVKHLEWLGMRKHFQVILGSDGHVNGKPHPDLAIAACAKLQIAPERTLMFGDTKADIQMAREARLAGIVRIGLERTQASDGEEEQISHYEQLQWTSLTS
ncbi:HAD family hydrolase [Paenibacillus chitinolyticus]|uniref:HAD family hydrolase n=1 Tax=Paenibacillus chitinolyticus TaxID=79263 RepID=UPI00366BCBE1